MYTYIIDNRELRLTCSGLQLAKQLDSWEDVVTVIVTEVVDSVSGVLPHRWLQARAYQG